MPYRKGRKSAAQTPAPRSERIYGSKKNPKGTASSKTSAKDIVLSDKTISALKEKAREYNKTHKNKVSLNTLKAVYRRGLGAYSSSHRPTITGGVPNTRNAWAMARVNKFLKKKAGQKVKAAYVQDDDLLEEGGMIYHGSPYKFSKFDISKLGEGEGAQRFGYGVYVTDLKADGTNTTFDESNPDIRFEDGGKLKKLASGYYEGEYKGVKFEITKQEENAYGGKPMWYYQIYNEDLGYFGRADDLYFTKSKALESAKQTIDESKDKFGDGGKTDEVITCSNCGWSWKESETTPEEKYICHKCGHNNAETMDTLKMDVPLFIRLLEFAREDAKDDMALHTLTENALKLGDKTLTMEDYEQIVSSKITKMKEDLIQIPTIEEEFKEGGVVVGKRHSESDENGTGEKFLVESTGQVVELEGGEGVLSKESMESEKLYTFDGKKMTGRQIASFLNHKYGGVQFSEGGEVDKNAVCGCRSKYYHGGELPSATLDSLKGGEAVVTVKTMESKDKYQFQGRQLTPRKILSHINQQAGGKKFEDGGIIDLTEHHLKNINKLTKMVMFTEKILYF